MEKQKQLYGTVLIKADKILAYLSSCDNAQPLHAIAKETSLTNSTALKILDTLTFIGYVRKDDETKKFSLGPSIIKYANRSIYQSDIKQIAQIHLEKLQEETTETVNLGIEDRSSIVYITKIESKNPVSLYSKVGKSIPMYCSAMGKAILADGSDDEIERYLLENELKKFTEKTITTKEAFRKEIAAIRQQGYAHDNSEHENDIFCIGTSITLNGKNYGAVSVSVPKYRLTDGVHQQIVHSLKKCKENILQDIQACS